MVGEKLPEIMGLIAKLCKAMHNRRLCELEDAKKYIANGGKFDDDDLKNDDEALVDKAREAELKAIGEPESGGGPEKDDDWQRMNTEQMKGALEEGEFADTEYDDEVDPLDNTDEDEEYVQSVLQQLATDSGEMWHRAPPAVGVYVRTRR